MNILFGHLVILISLVSASLTSSSGDHVNENEKSTRLFGVDLAASRPSDNYETSSSNEQYRQRQSSSLNNSERQFREGGLAAQGVDLVLVDPQIQVPDNEMRLLSDPTVCRYRFNVLNPATLEIEPVNVLRGHGPAYVAGHPNNQMRIVSSILIGQDEDESTRRPKEEILRSLKAFQQAMRYLNSRPNAAISHEPSGKIYLSPDVDCSNMSLIQKIQFKYGNGDLPRLVKEDGVAYFVLPRGSLSLSQASGNTSNHRLASTSSQDSSSRQAQESHNDDFAESFASNEASLPDYENEATSRLPRHLHFAQALEKYGSAVRSRGLQRVLDDARPHLSSSHLKFLLERYLHKYDFKVLNPRTGEIKPVNIRNGHGSEYYFGHPRNSQWLQEYYVNRQLRKSTHVPP